MPPTADPRISAAGLRVLREFVMAPEARRYGAEIGKATGVGPGTLYPLLARLQDAGWITSTMETGDPSLLGRPLQRYHLITPLGLDKARSALSRLQLDASEWTLRSSPAS